MSSSSMNSLIHSTLSSPSTCGNQVSNSSVLLTIIPQAQQHEQNQNPSAIDYRARAQWLRAAVLGANDGLVSVASLMIGVGAVNQTAKAMLVSGLAGLVAGTCSMAIGEFVSVYTQYDIELEARDKGKSESLGDDEEEEISLPSPLQAASASALAFAFGALLPLLAGGFIRPWGFRVGAVGAASSLGLAGFGAAGAALGGANVGRSALRVLVGGWLAMLVTYGVLRLFGLLFRTGVSYA